MKKPTVSIKTDKFIYSDGKLMHIRMEYDNPTTDDLMLRWWCIPKFEVVVLVYSRSVPAGTEDTLTLLYPIPHWAQWSLPPFGVVFYVQLLDDNGKVSAADATCWAYDPSAA